MEGVIYGIYKRVMRQFVSQMVWGGICRKLRLVALRTTLTGFGEWPVKRSLPDSARRRTAGSLVRGLCPVRPKAY